MKKIKEFLKKNPEFASRKNSDTKSVVFVSEKNVINNPEEEKPSSTARRTEKGTISVADRLENQQSKVSDKVPIASKSRVLNTKEIKKEKRIKHSESFLNNNKK